MSLPLESVRRLIMAAMVLGAVNAHAQKTVADALALARGAIGPGPMPPLVGVAIDDSVDSETWNLVFLGAGVQSERRIISLVDGKVQPEAPRSVWPFSTGSFEVIRARELDLTISGLRRLAAERSTRLAIKPASLKYVLNRKPGESFAVWDVYLIDRKRIVIGHIRIDASSGSIVREEFSSGNASGTRQPDPSPQVASPNTTQRDAAGRTTLRIVR